VRACVKVPMAVVTDKGGYRNDNRKQGSKEEEKSLCPFVLTQVWIGRYDRPLCRATEGSFALSLSLSRSLCERPIVFEFADRRSEIPEIRLLTLR